MKNIILIGAGGHFRSCIDVIESSRKFKIIGVIDRSYKKKSEIFNYKYLGNDEEIDNLISKSNSFLITLGQIKDPKPRKIIFKKLKKCKANLPCIISKYAYCSKKAKLDKGSIIMNKAFVNTNAKIGSNCIINTGAIVEHDCIVKDNCHISTNVTLNGSVIIEENCFIGSNSVIIQGVKIGKNNVIPAGSVIKKNVV